MLYHQTEELLQSVNWSRGSDSPDIDTLNSVRVVECWDYPGTSIAKDGDNYRFLTIRERNMEEWLSQSGIYAPLKTPQNAGKVRGGLRLMLCERTGPQAGMLLTQQAFRSICTAFDLHPSTLPSFFAANGTFATFYRKDSTTGLTSHIHITVKAPQKMEINNCLLSLTYDIEAKWTYAFMCGSGLTKPRPIDGIYGSQERQLVGAILSDFRHWSNPLLVPCSLLHMSQLRAHMRLTVTDQDIIQLENHLGVTFAGGAGLPDPRERWPEDIDAKKTAKSLHSVLSQIIFMHHVCRWQNNYSSFLLDLETDLSNDKAALQNQIFLGETRDTLKFLKSTIDNLSFGFNAVRDRTASQINLLFSVVSQQDSLISRRSNELNSAIAQSTKQDSISMSTFTFITAFFLPGTYIASLFSISMFNWGTSGSSVDYVSNRFWIYWAVTIPLTLVTMLCWYTWFNYANKSWTRKLRLIA